MALLQPCGRPFKRQDAVKRNQLTPAINSTDKHDGYLFIFITTLPVHPAEASLPSLRALINRQPLPTSSAGADRGAERQVGDGSLTGWLGSPASTLHPPSSKRAQAACSACPRVCNTGEGRSRSSYGHTQHRKANVSDAAGRAAEPAPRAVPHGQGITRGHGATRPGPRAMLLMASPRPARGTPRHPTFPSAGLTGWRPAQVRRMS